VKSLLKTRAIPPVTTEAAINIRPAVTARVCDPSIPDFLTAVAIKDCKVKFPEWA